MVARWIGRRLCFGSRGYTADLHHAGERRRSEAPDPSGKLQYRSEVVPSGRFLGFHRPYRGTVSDMHYKNRRQRFPGPDQNWVQSRSDVVARQQDDSLSIRPGWKEADLRHGHSGRDAGPCLPRHGKSACLVTDRSLKGGGPRLERRSHPCHLAT